MFRSNVHRVPHVASQGVLRRHLNSCTRGKVVSAVKRSLRSCEASLLLAVHSVNRVHRHLRPSNRDSTRAQDAAVPLTKTRFCTSHLDLLLRAPGPPPLSLLHFPRLAPSHHTTFAQSMAAPPPPLAPGEMAQYLPNLQSNQRTLDYVRSSCVLPSPPLPLPPCRCSTNTAPLLPNRTSASSSISGSLAGLLGLTNLAGFTFYLITSLLVSFLFASTRCQGKPGKFYGGKEGVSEWSGVLLGGVLENAFGFVLFWTCELIVGLCGLLLGRKLTRASCFVCTRSVLLSCTQCVALFAVSSTSNLADLPLSAAPQSTTRRLSLAQLTMYHSLRHLSLLNHTRTTKTIICFKNVLFDSKRPHLEGFHNERKD